MTCKLIPALRVWGSKTTLHKGNASKTSTTLLSIFLKALKSLQVSLLIVERSKGTRVPRAY